MKKTVKSILCVLLSCLMCLSFVTLFAGADDVETVKVYFRDLEDLKYNIKDYRSDWITTHQGYHLGKEFKFIVSVKNNKPTMDENLEIKEQVIDADDEFVTVRRDQFVELTVWTADYIEASSVQLAKYPNTLKPAKTWYPEGTTDDAGITIAGQLRDEYFLNQTYYTETYGFPCPTEDSSVYVATYYMHNTNFNADLGEQKYCSLQKVLFAEKATDQAAVNEQFLNDTVDVGTATQPVTQTPAQYLDSLTSTPGLILYAVENRIPGAINTDNQRRGIIEKKNYNPDENGNVLNVVLNTRYTVPNNLISYTGEDYFFTVTIPKSEDIHSDTYEVCFYRTNISKNYEDRVILRDAKNNKNDGGVVDETKDYQYLDRYETESSYVDVFRIKNGDRYIEIQTDKLKDIKLSNLFDIIKGLVSGEVTMEDISKMNLNPIIAFISKLVALILKIVKGFTG